MAGVTSVVLGAALGWAGAPAAQAATFTPDWQGRAPGGDVYVAMGDSFAAGPGIKPQRTTDRCARSERNYASLLAASLGSNTFTDASCAGAKTEDFATTQTGSYPARGPQYDALTADTTLVTLGTIGGNDVGLVQLAYSCVSSDCGADPQAVSEMNARIDALTPTIAAAIGEVRLRAPLADIVVVGYGTYVPKDSCSSLFGVTAAEATYLQGSIDRMSDALKDAVDQAASGGDAKVTFADMRTIPGISRHTACSAPGDQWVRAMNTYEDGAPLHPSTLGMANWAGRLKQYVQQMRGETVDPWREVVAPKPPQDPGLKPRAKLRAAGSNLRFAVTCNPARTTAIFRVRGGHGLVRSVQFRVGAKKVTTDRRAPFRATAKPVRVKRFALARRGKLSAKVTLATGGHRLVRVLKVPRGRCF